MIFSLLISISCLPVRLPSPMCLLSLCVSFFSGLLCRPQLVFLLTPSLVRIVIFFVTQLQIFFSNCHNFSSSPMFAFTQPCRFENYLCHHIYQAFSLRFLPQRSQLEGISPCSRRNENVFRCVGLSRCNYLELPNSIYFCEKISKVLHT